MREHTILRIVTKVVVPLILLFALYVQFHGDYGPGGGFQAGVIFAAGVILYALVFGLRAARLVFPPALLRGMAAGGVLIYAGTGMATMLLGGNFLAYNQLARHGETGQELGIFLVELGVGVTVAGVMISIFFTFAGRGRRGADPVAGDNAGEEPPA